MLDDPNAMTSANWNDIHNWLTLFWIYFPIVIAFAFTMMVAHAFIPSLIMTGHLPPNFNRLRMPMTGAALVLLIVAVILLVFIMNSALNVEKVWNRMLF